MSPATSEKKTAPAEGRTARAEGTTASGEPWHIHYTVKGEGPAVIMLHGGGPGASGMGNYSRNLDALAEHFTVYVIDFPGWAQSSKNLSSFGARGPFTNGARAIHAFMNAVGIDKAHLVGNSFGGAAAYFVAMEWPERVGRIITMGPAGAYLEGVGHTPGAVQLGTYYTGEGPTREKIAAFLQNLVHDTSVLTPEFIDGRFALSNDPEIIANPPLRLPHVAPPKASYVTEDPRLKTLPHHCLLIWGIQDKVNLPAGVKAYEVVPNQDVFLFDNCGHWAQWEYPEKFNEVAVWFLRRP